MAGTLLSALETQIRYTLIESTASFWSSAEIIAILNNGVQDLWKAVVDLDKNYFRTIDATNVSQAADGTTLTGVPADVYKVSLIEPRDLTVSGPTYLPKAYEHPDFQQSRSLSSQDSNGLVIYYDIGGAGPPTGAPTIYVAPAIDASLNLTLVYQATVGALTSASNNPIPGPSDEALVAWGIAYARAKERDDRSPDPAWIATYATLKRSLITSLTPRQTQEPTVAEGVWEGMF